MPARPQPLLPLEGGPLRFGLEPSCAREGSTPPDGSAAESRAEQRRLPLWTAARPSHPSKQRTCDGCHAGPRSPTRDEQQQQVCPVGALPLQAESCLAALRQQQLEANRGRAAGAPSLPPFPPTRSQSWAFDCRKKRSDPPGGPEKPSKSSPPRPFPPGACWAHWLPAAAAAGALGLLFSRFARYASPAESRSSSRGR